MRTSIKRSIVSWQLLMIDQRFEPCMFFFKYKIYIKTKTIKNDVGIGMYIND